jgi:two-component system sensor histidine kinase CiaH
MFKEARIKLTGWYLLIIMIISLSFSAAIYGGLCSELNRVERMQRLRIEQQFPGRPDLLQQFEQRIEPRNLYLDPALINETKTRILIILLGINSFILVSSAVAGYFLAGRTLQPIKVMFDEQKRFTADASHEFRTPLTSMKTEIEVALRDKKINLREIKNLLKSNLEEVNKMQKLSNYLLALNKYEEDGKSIEFTNVDLKGIVKRVVDKLSILAKEKKISLQLNLKSAKVFGNETAVSELTSILVENAIKYSPSSSKIFIRTRKDDGHGILEIQDFGIGIAKEDLPHIFDRFYRAELSRSKEKASGYGLGLSIAKSIVDLHKGKIEVKSKLGKGSTFIVRI